MRIVQVNTVCGTGSTGKIALALHRLAVSKGYDSYIAYGRGTAPEDIQTYKIGSRVDFVNHVLVNFFLGKSGFGSKKRTEQFLKWLDGIQPDILHLHNLHGFYLNIELLFEYIKKNNIAVVWTFHDCWPFTGQCAHFDYANCDKWKIGCEKCPIFRSNYPYSIFKDNSVVNYKEKKRIFTGVEKLMIVTPSQWLAELTKQSFFGDYPVLTINNGIDLEVFKPQPNKQYGSCKVVLGVANVWTKQKGYDAFLELSQKLDDSYQVVLIGVSKAQKRWLNRNFPNIVAITRTKNQTELADWYSRAYVYVNPTLEDTFPTTNLEALACGTPVITYRTGGSPEAIDSSCGIVVDKRDIDGISRAIYSLSKRDITSESCRKSALKFNKEKRFNEYMDLYEQLS